MQPSDRSNEVRTVEKFSCDKDLLLHRPAADRTLPEGPERALFGFDLIVLILASFVKGKFLAEAGSFSAGEVFWPDDLLFGPECGNIIRQYF